MRMRTVLLAFAVAALGTVACGDDEPASPASPTPTPTTPTPQPPSLSGLSIRNDGGAMLDVGDTLTLTACASYSDGSEDCTVTAQWESLAPEVASVDDGRVTARAAGTATIQASYEGRTATLELTVTVPAPQFAFDPEPPSALDEGETGHFRVNITQGRSRQRLTEGVTSSASGVIRLNLEGDRWRYTATGPGRAEIRVEHDGVRRLTHLITVTGPDYEITNVNRYNAIIDTSDWLYFTWRARTSASRFTVNVKFQQGPYFTTCEERWYDPVPGAQERELSIPSVCGPDEQWSSVTIEPADGRTCRGCGTYQRTSLQHSRDLGPAEETRMLQQESAEGRSSR